MGVVQLVEGLQKCSLHFQRPSRAGIRKSLPQIEVVAGDSQMALIFRHLEPLTKADEQALASFSKRFDIGVFLQSGGPKTIKKLFRKI